MANNQIEGIFFSGWTAAELLTLRTTIKNLILEGKTVVTGSMGSKNFSKVFPVPCDKILLEITAALKKVDPTTYGRRITRTSPSFT